MSPVLKTFWSLLLSILVVVLMVLPVRVQIDSPRLGVPLVIKAEQEFNVLIKSSLPFYLPSLSLSLLSDSVEYPLQLLRANAGVLNHQLKVKAVVSIPPGQYTLKLRHDKKSLLRPNSVYVLEQFPKTLSLVQLADLPVLGGSGQGDALFKQIITEINIINPDVVLLSGDLAYGGSWDQYSRLLKLMELFMMPVIAVPGNHEYEGWGAYLKLLGEPYHKVDYGDYRFISLNSGHGKDQLTHSQYSWLLEQLESSRESTVPVIQIHHPLHHKAGLRGYLQVHVQDMVRLVNRYRVPIVLSGHWHGDAVYDSLGRERTDTWDFEGAPYVVTTTAGADLREPYSNSPLHYGYRLVRLDRHKLLSYTYDYDADGVRDHSSSMPTGKLSVRFVSPRHAVLLNQLNEDLEHARVSFVVKGKHPGLVSSVGKIQSRTSLGDGIRYDVLLHVPANSEIQIQLVTP